MRRTTSAAALVVASLLSLAACGGGGTSAPKATPQTTPAQSTRRSADAAGTVWLCRPGVAPDPCAVSAATTVVASNGSRTTTAGRAAAAPPVDCFYVEGTVSPEPGPNADLTVQAPEVDTAEAQVTPFSQVCRVWAPMYRQVTVAALFRATQADLDVAFASLKAAFDDYLANDNGGRPIVFIGHSQGAAMLIRLLEAEVDPSPALRAQTLLAILAGGNVVVASGATVGGSFAHLPLCTASAQRGCVIAYSTFGEAPPTFSLFGRPGMGVSLLAGQTQTTGLQVACTNPAALAGGEADLHTVYPASAAEVTPPVRTPYVEFDDLYRADCQQADGASWLQVTTLAAGGRPTVREVLGPEWGYHVDDVNLPLGDLVADVRAAAGER